MLIAHNDYFPYSIAPDTTVDIFLEDVVTKLPILHGKVIIRSQEPSNEVDVTWTYQLTVSEPLSFAGNWQNTLLDTGIVGPEGLLVLDPVQACVDGVYGKHRLQITNPSLSDTVLVHVLVNGMVESASAAPAQTYVSTP